MVTWTVNKAVDPALMVKGLGWDLMRGVAAKEFKAKTQRSKGAKK